MDNALFRLTPLAVLLLWSAGVYGSQPAPNLDRIALEGTIHLWMTAINTQDADTLSKTMTEDVELLDNTATVKGRSAAIAALSDVAARGHLGGTTREITIAHEVAWRVVGITQTQKNGDVHSRGQALEIWKRVKGKWQLHRQMAAGVIAPADLLTRPSTGEPVLDRPNGRHP